MINYVDILDTIFFEATEQDVAKRIPLWMDKYGVSRDLILSAIAADPTNGKYSEWIVKQIKNGTVIFPEDQDKIRKNLQLFHTKKSKLAIKDINQYDPGSLAQALNQQLGLTKSERKATRRGDFHLPPGAELVLSDGPYDVVLIGSGDLEEGVKAANLLSSGTEWCTAVPSHAKRYLQQGPLYLIYKDSVRKYLVHFPSDQFKDVFDNEVNGPLGFYAKQDLERKGKGAIVDVKGSIISLLYPLTGIDHYQVPSYILAYSISVGRRWPEAERYLLGSEDALDSAVIYAQKIIKNRWPALEQHLLSLKPENEWDSTAPSLLVTYAMRVLKPLGLNRWPEAEPIILYSRAYAVSYAANFMYDRWPELEKKLLASESAYPLSLYAIAVLKPLGFGRWPEAESIIILKGGQPLREYIHAFDLIYSQSTRTLSPAD